MKKFQPTLIPTIFTIAAFLTLVSLGSWQIYRLQWKNHLIETVTREVAKPPIPMSEDNAALSALTYRRVILDGSFLNDHELYRYQQNQGKPGYEVVTPFKQNNGQVVMVNRGWIPMELRDLKKRPGSQIEGETRIGGIVTEKEKRQSVFTPDNSLKDNVWFWMDFDAIQAETGLNLQPVIIHEVGENTPGRYPMKLGAELKFRNDHLSYAIIWFSLSIICVIIYYLYHLKDVNRLERI